MRILILADDIDALKRLPADPVDVVVSCGDLPDEIMLEAADHVRASSVLAVKGNHDRSGAFMDGIVDLHLQAVSVGDTTFGGFCGSWRYKSRGHFLFEDYEVDRALKAFPPVDVFVAHNSPRHVHDQDDDVHYGFTAFAQYIREHQPKFFLHGHQHVTERTRMGSTWVVGTYGFQYLEI